MARKQKLIHLHGTTTLTAELAKTAGMAVGEIAIKNGEEGTSELYVLTKDGQKVETFITKAVIEASIKAVDEKVDALIGDDGSIAALKADLEGQIEAAEANANDYTDTAVNTAVGVYEDEDSGVVASGLRKEIAEKAAAAQKAGEDAAASALDEAKEYTDTVAGAYAAEGVAASGLRKEIAEAEAEAKEYTDTVAGAYADADAGVEASGLRKEIAEAKDYADVKIKELTDDTITPHISNTTVHITEQERIDWNQAKKDIDDFFASDAKIEGTIDTLREIQDWLNNTENKDASDIITLISEEAKTREEEDGKLSDRIAAFEGETGSIANLQTQITEITKDGGELDKHQAAAIEAVQGNSNTDTKDSATVAGAKKYAKEEATNAKDAAIEAVQGNSNTDTKESATIVGAKKYADDKATTAKSEAISAVQGSETDTVASATIVGAKKYAADLNDKMDERVIELETAKHTHGNKDLLDTYAQTEANLADAVAKKHEHENKTVLDGITAEDVTAWSNAEANAKNYVDELDGGTISSNETGTYVTVSVESKGGKVTEVTVTEDYSSLVIDCGTYDE